MFNYIKKLMVIVQQKAYVDCGTLLRSEMESFTLRGTSFHAQLLTPPLHSIAAAAKQTY